MEPKDLNTDFILIHVIYYLLWKNSLIGQFLRNYAASVKIILNIDLFCTLIFEII